MFPFQFTFSPTHVPTHETIVSSPCSYNVLVPRTTLANRLCPIETQLFTSDFSVFLHTLVHARLHYVITMLFFHSAIEFHHPFHSTIITLDSFRTETKIGYCLVPIFAFEFLRHISCYLISNTKIIQIFGISKFICYVPLSKYEFPNGFSLQVRHPQQTRSYHDNMLPFSVQVPTRFHWLGI